MKNKIYILLNLIIMITFDAVALFFHKKSSLPNPEIPLFTCPKSQ